MECVRFGASLPRVCFGERRCCQLAPFVIGDERRDARARTPRAPGGDSRTVAHLDIDDDTAGRERGARIVSTRPSRLEI